MAGTVNTFDQVRVDPVSEGSEVEEPLKRLVPLAYVGIPGLEGSTRESVSAVAEFEPTLWIRAVKVLAPGSIMLSGEAVKERRRKFCGAAIGAKANEVVSVCFMLPPLAMKFAG